MAFYDPQTPTLSADHRRIHAAYEIAHTVVDFSAALLFVVGSILFFWEETTYAATWLFLIGSICFALKPTIKLLREVRYWRMGQTDILADRDEAG